MGDYPYNMNLRNRNKLVGSFTYLYVSKMAIKNIKKDMFANKLFFFTFDLFYNCYCTN